MKAVGYIVAGLLFVSLIVGWQVYRWHDCRMVGHSVFYCIMTSGK